MNHKIKITYCTKCRWLLRATWMMQELLVTFEDELSEVTVCPGTGGVFDIELNGKTLWSRKDKGRFPELKELKQRVRDEICPSKSLGHSDG